MQMQLALGDQFNNRGLFADHFLNDPQRNLLRALPEWQQPHGLDEAFAAIQKLFREKAARFGPNTNEAHTEHDFVQPVLNILWAEAAPGDCYQVQVGIPNLDARRQPDYALFRKAADRDAAEARKGAIEYWRDVPCLGDAKKWSSSLDKQRGADENPSGQIANYLYRSRVRWGILTNGRLWRLYEREKSSAGGVFYEVNLQDLLERGDHGSFKYFYLFFRREAFVPDTSGRSFVEKVFQGSVDYATAVGDRLKESVYDALCHLMNGFLAHPSNGLDAHDAAALKLAHENCLIVLYRLLFILYAEDRGLLRCDDENYRAYCLRDLHGQINRHLRERHPLLPHTTGHWHHLLNLFALIDNGFPEGGIPAYNGGLFSPARHPHIAHEPQPGAARWEIGDRYLAGAIDLLAYERDRWNEPGARDIDYNTLDVRHLGSIYEGLLELQPHVAAEPLVETLAEGKAAFRPAREAPNPRPIRGQPPRAVNAGEVYLVTNRGERKATGSYYTPQYIVSYIVEHTVGPLADEAAQKVAALRPAADKEVAKLEKKQREWEKVGNKQEVATFNKSISDEKRKLLAPYLALKILDPAMGSGHFLVGAADFLSLAMTTDPSVLVPDDLGDEEPQAYYKRLVVEHCLYGVDLNPLAVELAKLSLWLHTASHNKALSFLDHHLRCGNSLIGARVEEDLAKEPPLFNARGKRVNAESRQLVLGFTEALTAKHLSWFLDTFRKIVETPTGDAATERLKDQWYREMDTVRDQFRAVANCWLAPYFGAPVTPEQYQQAVQGLRDPPALAKLQSEPWFARAQAVAKDKRFFHWELEFPEVFFNADGLKTKDQRGFDTAVGNPPYGDILTEDEKGLVRDLTGTRTGGRAEVYADFVARGLANLAVDRHLSFVIPNTLIDGAQFRAFRALLGAQATVRRLRDFRERRVFAAADVVTMVIHVQRSQATTTYALPYEFWDSASNTFRLAEMAITPQSEAPWRVADRVLQCLQSQGKCVPLEPGMGTCHDAGVDYKWKGVGWQDRGTRQPLSEFLFYSGARRHAEDYPLLRGEDIARYSLQFSNHFLVHDFAKYRTKDSTVLVYLDLLLAPLKILTRQTADRIEATTDTRQFVTAKSIHSTLLKPTGHSASYLLAVLNSDLLTYIYRILTGEVGRAFAQVKLYDLRQLPIRRLEFTTPANERAQLLAKGKELYERGLAKSDPDGVLEFVEEQLSAKPERADVVHDLLAFLAEQMIEMNKQKQAEVKGFLTWLERQIGAKIDDLSNKTKIKDYHAHDLDALLSVVQANRRKLGAGVNPAARNFQEAVEKEFTASLAKLTPLKARLAATDTLIDEIVYRLYGLTEEEIKIVKGESAAAPTG